MDDLILQLKKDIIEVMNFDDITPDDIGDDDPLFGDGLGLDSIDALELVVMLEKNYGIKVKDTDTGKKIFVSVRTLAEYVSQHRK